MADFSEETLSILQRSVLFKGINANEVRPMLGCLKARERSFEKGEYIYRIGDETTALGVVISGKALVENEDYWGNVNILVAAVPGDMFAEAFACMPDEASRVNVVADTDCRVVLMDVSRIVGTCTSACAFHQRIIRNLLTVLARKNLALTQKNEHLTKRSTREKVLSYLSTQSRQVGSSSFDIPFNRQQLADYLSVERSALSSCLSKMQKDGVIRFRKSHFELL